MKVHTILVAIIALLCAVCIRAMGQSQTDSHDETQTGMNALAAADYQKADGTLNQEYEKLLSGLADDAAKKNLQAAEKAWIAFRDAEADSVAESYSGGSMEPMIREDSLTDITNRRIAQIDARITADYQKADAKLNDEYTKLMGTLSDDAEKKKLQAAEKAWIAFRDLEANWVSNASQGRAPAAIVRDTCLIDLTNDRIAEIDARIDEVASR